MWTVYQKESHLLYCWLKYPLYLESDYKGVITLTACVRFLHRLPVIVITQHATAPCQYSEYHFQILALDRNRKILTRFHAF
jgi:hypothetical protein